MGGDLVELRAGASAGVVGLAVPFRIRAATTADLPSVLALWERAAAEPTHTDDLASLEQLLAHDPDALLLLVTETDDGIAGSIIAGWDGWRGSIYRLVVAPEHRRSGYGRRLLAAAEEQLAGAGAVRMQAIVVSTDGQATRFWRASDWEHQAERYRFVKG